MTIEHQITKRMSKNEIVLNRELMYIANFYITLTRIFKRSIKGQKYTTKTETRNVILKDEIFVESKMNDSYVISRIENLLTTRFEKHSQETFIIDKIICTSELSYVHNE